MADRMEDVSCSRQGAWPRGQRRRTCGPLAGVALGLVLVCGLSPAAFAGPTELLGTLVWGQSVEEVLNAQRERLLQEYRVEVAGLGDPLEIDRVRRRFDDRYERMAASLETLDGPRSGYEVSAFGGEVAAGQGLQILAARWPEGTTYFVFRDGQLARRVILLETARLPDTTFDELIDAMEAQLGGAAEREHLVDEIGRRTVVRATWQDEASTFRMDNREWRFQTIVLVLTDRAWANAPQTPLESLQRRRGAGGDAASSGSGARPSAADLLQRSRPSDVAERGDLLDEMLGIEVEVTTRLREDESEAPQEEAGEEVAEPQRPRTPARPRTTREQQRQEQQGQDGVTFY